MGQIGCSKTENDDIHRYSLTISKCQSMRENHYQAQQMMLGEQMKIGRNAQMQQEWESWLAGTDIDKQMLEQRIKSPEEFFERGLRGIPQQFRWAYWKATVVINGKLQYDIRSSQSNHCINKDANRTLIHEYFDNPEGHENLNRVLNALANTNPKIGYCQGMNYLAALLLMVSGLKEEETFQMFNEILTQSKYMMQFLFMAKFPLLKPLEYLIISELKIKLPKIHQHLLSTETDNAFWLTKILLSAFVYVFHYQDCVLLWDYILIRGTIKGYTELVLSIMDYFQKEILSMDAVEIATFYSSKIQYQANNIIKNALSKFQLDDKYIRKRFRSYPEQDVFKKLLTKYNKKQYDALFLQILNSN